MCDHPINSYNINLQENLMLSSKQKINFITYFFLKLLQRNGKLAVFGHLGLSGPSKMIVSIWRNFSWLSSTKTSTSFFPCSLRYAKISQNFYFGYFGQGWLLIPKVILSLCRKLLYLSAGKRTTSSHIFFWRYCKAMQTSYFRYFGHAWLRTPKMIIPTCRKLWYFTACQK